MADRDFDIDKIGGEYNQDNPKSDTVGRYFIPWNTQASSIKKITGVKSKQEFLDNPDAQEKYFKWYADNKLKAPISRIKELNKAGYTDDELAKLVHFKGETGAKRFLKENQEVIRPVTPKVDSHITPAEKDAWENMQAAAFQRGIYPEEISTPKGAELMQEFGINPSRLPAYQADIASRAQEQQQSGALQQVSHGFSTGKDETNASPRQRYVHYLAQIGDKPLKDFGTDIDAFIAYGNAQKAKTDAEYAGFGDPTQDVNYQVPGTVSGFGSSPGMSSDQPAAIPDPRFPTRDPITGRVTPAVQK